MALAEQEQQQINGLVRRFETQTGIEAVAAVVDRCDAYPEIPWKAYALGSALAALGLVLQPTTLMGWTAVSAMVSTMAVLGIGAAFAALATVVPAVGRLFLDRTRAELEARQYAIGMFLERELFRTARREAVVLLLARYEQVAVVLPDRGLRAHAPRESLDRLARSMRSALIARGLAYAFETGLDGLRSLLEANGYVARPAGTDALADAIVTERGV